MLRVFRDFNVGEFIVIGADTAWGGQDFCAAQFMSQTGLDVPMVFHKQCLGSDMTPVLHAEAERIYDITGVKPTIAIERQNGGVAELERLVKLNRNQKYTVYQQRGSLGDRGSAISRKYGWDTTSISRPVMLGTLKESIDNKLIRIYDEPTITEMFSFVEKQTATGWKPQAESGAHDDLIMSLAICLQLYQSEKAPQRTKRVKRQRYYDKITGRALN